MVSKLKRLPTNERKSLLATKLTRIFRKLKKLNSPKTNEEMGKRIEQSLFKVRVQMAKIST
jgi:hypothetical protein